MIDRHYRVLPWLAASILVAAFLIPLSGCELFGGEAAIVQEIQDATGIDVNDPFQVGAAAVGGTLLGNKDAKDGVAVLEGYQRARHEQVGDKYYNEGQYPRAREEYKEALRWANTNTNAGKYKAAEIHAQTARTYVAEGETVQAAAKQTNDPVIKADLEKAAREKYARAANDAERAGKMHLDPIMKALAYADQADYLRSAGQPEQACATAKKAYELSPDGYMGFVIAENCP
ncbi:MAG: hypothetical protein HYY30_03415 [Chloroflexi bacterium]|nr:hypothetical protein [Chloroflexota bacterium]